MAETVLSPGVYLNENDQSFVTQGVVSTGAVIVGPTNKGAAFVPTVVTSFNSNGPSYASKFGKGQQHGTTSTYVPQTVDALFKAGASSVMVTRVLGGGGFKFNSTRKLVGLIDSCSGELLTVLYPGLNAEDLGLGESFTTPGPGTAESYKICILQNDTGSLLFNNNNYSASFYVEQSDGTEQLYNFVFSGSVGFAGSPPAGTISASITAAQTVAQMADQVSASFVALGTDFSASIVDSGDGCLTFTNIHTGSVTDIVGGWNSTSASVDVLSQGTDNAASISEDFLLTLSGSNFASQSFSASLSPSSDNYITNLGSNANSQNPGGVGGDNAFVYLNFSTRQSALLADNCEVLIATSSAALVEFTGSTAEGYDHGRTPWITSGNSAKQLFRFHHRGDGFDTNNDVYISITDLVEPADIDGVPQYSTFTVSVNKVGGNTIQSYKVDLDPTSPSFISRMIGDSYESYNTSLGKVIRTGEFGNIDTFVRVEVSNDIKVGAASPKLSPRGHSSYYDVGGLSPHFLPSCSLQTQKIRNGQYNENVFLGFDLDNYYEDNKNYLNPVPKVDGVYLTGNNDPFNIDTLFGHPSSSYWNGSLSASVDIAGASGPIGRQLQFNVFMQFGNDGVDYQTFKYSGADITSQNLFGMDLSSTSTPGGQAYSKAISILSNTDKYDFNVISTPGVIDFFHSSVVNQTLNMVEGRGDAIYTMDLTKYDATVSQAASGTSTLDSSYAAVYYPWVKMRNVDDNQLEYYPTSVVIPAVYHGSDISNGPGAQPWFAPAGLTRGGVNGVVETQNPLTKFERDVLYQSRVNPIAEFPSNGVVVYGQKTLQRVASALDRVNVRRLLINVKKYVDAQSRFLVFEQNSAATRQRFLDLVNPYMQSIQERQGVYAYRVQMDESNNTPDVIDRNELVGAIFLQPTKTAEFIKIDFNIQATGTQI